MTQHELPETVNQLHNSEPNCEVAVQTAQIQLELGRDRKTLTLASVLILDDLIHIHQMTSPCYQQRLRLCGNSSLDTRGYVAEVILNKKCNEFAIDVFHNLPAMVNPRVSDGPFQ